MVKNRTVFKFLCYLSLPSTVSGAMMENDCVDLEITFTDDDVMDIPEGAPENSSTFAWDNSNKPSICCADCH